MYIFLSFRNVIETFGESRFGEHKYSSWSWFRRAVTESKMILVSVITLVLVSVTASALRLR